MERVSVGKVPELSGSSSSDETQAPRAQSELACAILDGSSGVRSSLQFLLTALLNTFCLGRNRRYQRCSKKDCSYLACTRIL